MIFLFIGSFAATWGPMVWVYCAEMFPQQERSWCVGASTAGNWIGNFCIAQLTPILLGQLRFQTFWIFGLFCLVGMLLACWLPETKGLDLEHVGEIFRHKLRDTSETRHLTE